MPADLASNVIAEIDAALAAQRQIEAMRLYRDATQSTLVEARDFVEARQRELAIAGTDQDTAIVIPDAVQRYLDSGYARRGELVGWWRSPGGDWCVLVCYASSPVPLFEIGIFASGIGHWGHDLHGHTCTRSELDQALCGAGFYRAEWGEDGLVVAWLRERLQRSALLMPPRTATRGPARPSRSGVFLLDGERFEREWLNLPARVDARWWEPRRQRIAADSDLLELASVINIDCAQPQNVPLNLGVDAGPLLWSLCHEECARESVLAESSDTLFADLESQPPPWRDLAVAAQPAWNILLAMIDIGARQRRFLPWWLKAAAEQSTASVGLLSPLDTRRLLPSASELQGLFATHAAQLDIASRLQLCARAAQGGHWVLGWEPGT